MTAPISLNVLAMFIRDRARLLAWVAQARPSVITIMDDLALARYLRQQYPSMTVIHRRYHPDDHRLHETMTPKAWLDAHVGDAADGVIVQALNEPTASPALIAWCVELMALAHARGIRLCLPNFAVGNPNERSIESGAYDDLLRAFARYPEQLFGVHEYWKHAPTDPRDVRWLVGRFIYWLDRAKLIGVNKPRIILTEFGRDDGGGVNDGWRGVGIPEAQYADMLVQAHRLIYAPHGIPVCVFGYGAGADNRWQSFNVEGAETVLSKLAAYQESTPVPQVPTYPRPENLGDPAEHVVTWVKNLYVNLRALPSASSTDIGDVKTGDRVLARPLTWDGNGYKWARLERPAGWIASELLTLTPVDDVDAPRVKLDVPYVSQLGADAKLRGNDCGVAAALMVYRWRLAKAGLRAPRTLTVDRMMIDTPLSLKDAPQPLSVVQKLLDDYGVDAQVKRPLTASAIYAELTAGRPVILLVNYKHIGGEDFGHYIVVYGAGQRGFYYHDPYKLGSDQYIATADLERALTDVSGFAAFTHQGVVLAA